MNKSKMYKRAGWISIVVGTISSFLLLGLLLFAFPKSNLAFYIQSFTALFSIAWGTFLLSKGKSLEKKDLKEKEEKKESLLNSYAAKRGGILKTSNVAMLLGLSKEEAEAYVVGLVKQGRSISFEFDQDGEFVFYFDVPKPLQKEGARFVTSNSEEYIEEEYSRAIEKVKLYR